MNRSVTKTLTSKFFIICILLSLILCTGCISEHSSSDSQSNTDVTKSARFLNSTNGIYSINATVPVVTGKIMTYSLVKPNYSHNWVSLLAKKLGMSGKIRETPEAYFAEGSDGEKFIFTVFRNENTISFENRNAGSSGAMTDDEAKSAVKEFLKSADLMPPDASEPNVGGYNTEASFKQIVVTLSRKPMGLPVLHSTLMVTVGSEAKIASMFMVWPEYQPYKEVRIKSPEQAFEEFQKMHPYFTGSEMRNKTEKIVITDLSLVYSTGKGNFLQPTYLFEGYGLQGNYQDEFVPIEIPACDEPLEVTAAPLVSTNPGILSDEPPSPELMEQLKNLNFQYHDLNINKWEFDQKTNDITLYVYDIHHQSLIDDLQGTHIRNYSVKLIHDTEFERTRDEIYDNLSMLRKDSRYKINTINMGTDAFGIANPPPGYYAEVWVDELTPENRKLDNTMIQGWRIEIIKPSYSPESIRDLTKSNPSTP